MKTHGICEACVFDEIYTYRANFREAPLPSETKSHPRVYDLATDIQAAFQPPTHTRMGTSYSAQNIQL